MAIISVDAAKKLIEGERFNVEEYERNHVYNLAAAVRSARETATTSECLCNLLQTASHYCYNRSDTTDRDAFDALRHERKLVIESIALLHKEGGEAVADVYNACRSL